MLNKIEEIVNKKIKELEELKKIAEKLRQDIDFAKFGFFVEDQKIYNLERKEINESVVATDSGFLLQRFFGFDYLVLKVAANFINYENGKIKEYKKKVRPIDIVVPNYNIDKDNLSRFASIKRQFAELDSLITYIKKENPNVAFIDGSILPLPSDRPSNDSKIYKEYEKLILKYIELYDLCLEKDVLLIATVEDSHSKTFQDFLKKDFNVNDVVLVDFILDKSEALPFFPMFPKKQNPIYYDLKKYASFDFYTTYLKIYDDLPLKVEVFQRGFNKVRDIVYNLSLISRRYNYPAPIVDVDKLSRIRLNEINTIKNYVFSKFNYYFIQRRERRI